MIFVEIESLKVEKERAMELLREQYESKMSVQESCTSSKYQENMQEMSTRLAEKSKHLSEMRNEIDNMRSILSERERELQSAITTINRLQEEIVIVKQQTIETQNERDSLETRLTQSQVYIYTCIDNPIKKTIHVFTVIHTCTVHVQHRLYTCTCISCDLKDIM